MNNDEIRKAVRGRYAEIATGDKPTESAGTPDESSCCAPQEAASAESCCAPAEAVNASSCCAPPEAALASDRATAETTSAATCGGSKAEASALAMGYSGEELGSIPEGANMGLGCGNPTALASLKEGEVVVDLGSGGGVDCFLAANAVGKSGSVIGVDMTPEMISKARENARRGGYENVDFRLGEIEHLPIADSSADAVISNCVINLSPDKAEVFEDAYRVLKPGGRVMVSDIVINRELPEHVQSSLAAWAGCIAGASRKDDYLATIVAAGFTDVEVVSEVSVGSGELEGAISSVNVRAVRPR